MTVDFKAVTAGVCAWCGRDKDEVFEVEFADQSFVGTYCRGDLLKAVTNKVPRRPRQPPTPAAPAASVPPADNTRVET